MIAHDQQCMDTLIKYLHMHNHIPAVEVVGRVVAEVVRIVVGEVVPGITMSSAVEFMICSGKLLLKSLLFSDETVPSNN